MSSLEVQRPPRHLTYLRLARVSNLPTVFSNVVGASALAVQAEPTTVGVVCISMGLMYTAGMFFNDYCDRQLDLQERPERPLPRGDVTPGEVLGITVGMFLLALLLLAYTGTLLWGLTLMLFIVLYDVWHKSNPLSPLLMASTRVMVYVIAASALSVPLSSVLMWALMLGFYVVGLTGLAKLETKKGLLPLWPLVALFLPAVLVPFLGIPLWGWGLVMGFVAWVTMQVRLSFQGRKHFDQVIGNLIAGMCLLDALVALHAGASWAGLVSLALFLLTLWGQRHIKGT